jgi:RNA polymerase sigma-70 factor (ECF subfamily)
LTQGLAAKDSLPEPPSGDALHDASFLSDLRRQMVKFAHLQLGDAHQAEDAVQEALVGALRNARSFGGRAALRTWVYAILKNKLADVLRQRQRWVDSARLTRDEEAQDDLLELFDARRHWTPEGRPGRWPGPESAMEDRQFWRAFEACLEHLPGQQARVFMMREFIEMESGEICAALDTTPGNLKVMLHRARLRLRTCLAETWFQKGEAPC